MEARKYVFWRHYKCSLVYLFISLEISVEICQRFIVVTFKSRNKVIFPSLNISINIFFVIESLWILLNFGFSKIAVGFVAEFIHDTLYLQMRTKADLGPNLIITSPWPKIPYLMIRSGYGCIVNNFLLLEC